jgi:hypothetical protein
MSVESSESARRGPLPVQFELYDFGSEMQDSCDFETPDFLISDSRFPMSSVPIRGLLSKSAPVQFELFDFGSEIQDSSDF